MRRLHDANADFADSFRALPAVTTTPFDESPDRAAPARICSALRTALPRSMSDSPEDRSSDPIGKHALDGAKEGLREAATGSLKWMAGGALVGALALGGPGLVKFGPAGLAIGAVVGALVGGLGAWWFYLQI